MNPIARLLVALLVLAGIGYAAYAFLTVPRDTDPETSGTTSGADVTMKSIKEDAPEYSIDITYPQFGIPAVDAYLDAAMRESADALIAQAATDTPVAHGFRKYELYGVTDHTYVGDDFVSARILLSTDFGGAHPLPLVTTYNFFRDTGQPVVLDDALALTGLSLEALASDALGRLIAEYGDTIIAPEGASATEENYQTFFIDRSDVTFIFQPYQVAPYAAGAPEVSFSRVR